MMGPQDMWTPGDKAADRAAQDDENRRERAAESALDWLDQAGRRHAATCPICRGLR